MSSSQGLRFRRHLSAPGLVKLMRECFERIDDPVRARKASLADNLMAALAMFMFKYPSMLQFDGEMRGSDANAELVGNLKRLYGLHHVPCDTSMRERLDAVDPQALRPAFKAVFSRLQRGKGLEGMESIDGHHLISIDGTEFFSSETVHCANCCVRNKRNGRQEHFHQMVCASLVGTGTGSSFPLVMPEMVLRTDGSAKNDCEHNALMRLLPQLRREHPHLRMAVLLDGLHGKAPQVRMLRQLGMNFIIGVKRKDHVVLYDQIEVDGETHEFTDADGTVHSFRWRNGAELNDSNRDILVNAVSYTQFTPERSVRKAGGRRRIVPESRTDFGWITDFEIGPDRLMEIMRAGRARWRIENEVFNVMKNQGLSLSHCYGHGHRNLCSVLAVLMMLAFLIDQVQERCCRVFQAARQARVSRIHLWARMCSGITEIPLSGWDHLMLRLAGRWPRPPPPAAT